MKNNNQLEQSMSKTHIILATRKLSRELCQWQREQWKWGDRNGPGKSFTPEYQWGFPPGFQWRAFRTAAPGPRALGGTPRRSRRRSPRVRRPALLGRSSRPGSRCGSGRSSRVNRRNRSSTSNHQVGSLTPSLKFPEFSTSISYPSETFDTIVSVSKLRYFYP